MLRTKRSVFETWLLVQTARPATGARTQPSTIRTVASSERQRNFRRAGRAVVRRLSTSRRSRSSSRRSSCGQRRCRARAGSRDGPAGSSSAPLGEPGVSREDSCEAPRVPSPPGDESAAGPRPVRGEARRGPADSGRPLIPSGRRATSRAPVCWLDLPLPHDLETDMPLNEYPAGAAFSGRDRADDRRVQPGVAATRPPGARLAERAHGRARRHRLRAARLLRQPDRDAELRRAGRERAPVQQHAHDGAVLAEPFLHRHRPQPPQQRHGRDHRTGVRLPRVQRCDPVRERLPLGDAARARLQHVHGRQVAPVAEQQRDRRRAV